MFNNSHENFLGTFYILTTMLTAWHAFSYLQELSGKYPASDCSHFILSMARFFPDSPRNPVIKSDEKAEIQK